MNKTFGKHKYFWLQKSFLFNALLGILLLVGSLYVNSFAQTYTATHASNYVTDILLDNLPTVDVHLIFSEGAMLFLFILAAILILEPKYIPFSLKCIALFFVIRSFFLILTHLAPPLHEVYIDPTDWIQRLSSGKDQFFSAHTGLPFLMSIIFWKEKFFRYFFMACTVVGGVAVILGHLHYSIDVFSALFISFGIFHIAKLFFAKDYRLTTTAAIKS
jgi:hypothetical protein